MVTVTRVVLDTKVLVAAAYNPASASRRIVEACLDSELTVQRYEWMVSGRRSPRIGGAPPGGQSHD